MENKADSINDLLSLFASSLSPEDVLSAKAMSEISYSITKERLRLSMNQQEFAEYIHATQSLVSRWESGKYNFSIQKLAEIATALDMDLVVKLRKKLETKYVSNHESLHTPFPAYTSIQEKTSQNDTADMFVKHFPSHGFRIKSYNSFKTQTENGKEKNYVRLCK